uniref:Uncharacterized protein n=1 Tax=Lotharella oceanica TaxID=641309 RepID=A0A7S2X9F6_9EUKA|mmetsp:Transcript_22137/g.41497  ORF Transcript_22137/g.41497 Transcript_22137/m.41497 type:complete len:327 (+) Transcript_22137:20-1000(+)
MVRLSDFLLAGAMGAAGVYHYLKWGKSKYSENIAKGEAVIQEHAKRGYQALLMMFEASKEDFSKFHEYAERYHAVLVMYKDATKTWRSIGSRAGKDPPKGVESKTVEGDLKKTVDAENKSKTVENISGDETSVATPSSSNPIFVLLSPSKLCATAFSVFVVQQTLKVRERIRQAVEVLKSESKETLLAGAGYAGAWIGLYLGCIRCTPLVWSTPASASVQEIFHSYRTVGTLLATTTLSGACIGLNARYIKEMPKQIANQHVKLRQYGVSLLFVPAAMATGWALFWLPRSAGKNAATTTTGTSSGADDAHCKCDVLRHISVLAACM